MTSPLVLRPATAVDSAALERLAALDSARPLTGAIVLAESDGVPRAALSLEDGRLIADPFVPTAGDVDLLRTRAASLCTPSRTRSSLSRLRRPSLA